MKMLCFCRVEMEYNPWNVSNLEEFLFYNCIECESLYSTIEQYVGHAIIAHKNACDILPKILNKKREASEETSPEGFDDNENENNPWNVSTLEKFRYFNCPQCENKYSTKEQFVGHAIVAHKKACDYLPKILHETHEASNEHELIEETDPEGFDDNVNVDASAIESTSGTSSTEREEFGTSTPEPLTIKIKKEQKNPIKKAMKVKESIKNRKMTSIYKCRECQTYFPSESKLQKHKWTHKTNTKCKQCGKEFSQRSDLNRHVQRVHEGVRDKCHLCPKTFYHGSGSLSAHIRSAHKGSTSAPRF